MRRLTITMAVAISGLAALAAASIGAVIGFVAYLDRQHPNGLDIDYDWADNDPYPDFEEIWGDIGS